MAYVAGESEHTIADNASGKPAVVQMLDRCLKEFTGRLNRRCNEDELFYYLTRRAAEGKPLSHHRLVAEPIG